MKKPLFLTVTALTLTLMFGQASFAQNDGGGAGQSGGTTTTRTTEQNDDGPDLGWLGLLGLAGLAGLLKKPERQVVHDTTARPTNNPNH